MKFEMKPTTTRAGMIGGIVGAVLQIFRLIPFVSCLVFPIGFLVPLGTGAYSVMLGRQAGAAGEIGQDAVDGGIAGVIAGVISGVVRIIVGLIGAVLGIALDVATGGDMTARIVANLGADCFLLIAAIIGGAVLGAVGGVVYGMIAKPQGGATMGGPTMGGPSTGTGAPKM